ncbi:nucleoside 2-deoxyribosyltransferase [Rhizobium mongolense]|uniref:Nucleoside 2-deoxyribosyltransferase n=2 Tax=Rhizobium mongolense TaxID=57676 RepID=A0ABR6IJQ5_9HYPH|nr:nucleoside 2-deoxyribosyltransferase [Rhizobium mongolense]MBB4227975.1 hypothetical protein [Rhizobium mongolense]TVZ64873.1 hypothetical protein BCL32_5144 [Rhizobium mongolense USDA 1844]
MTRIYVACGLTHVPTQDFDEYVKTIHEIAASASNSIPGADVKYALVNSDPQLAERAAEEKARLCYIWDRRMVEEADVVIAEASFPSTGLGIELQIAETSGTPVVLLYRDFGHNWAPRKSYVNPNDEGHHELQVGDGFITLMALGLPNVFKAAQYDSIEGAVSIVRENLSLLANRQAFDD